MKKCKKENLKIIYVSRTCSRQKFNEIENLTNTCASQKYNLLLAEGLAQNGAKLTLLSNPPIQKKLLNIHHEEKKDGVRFIYYTILNLPVFRNIFAFFSVLFYIIFCSRKNTVIISDTLNLSATYGAIFAGKIKRIPVIGIVTDVPGCALKDNELHIGDKIYRQITKKCSAYLFLTEQMNEIINKKNRPFVVLEGHSDIALLSVGSELANKDRQKICLFAGNLAKVNGLDYLIEGFLRADIPNAFLDIYGAGELSNELEIISKKYPNIRFMGSRPNSEIIYAEQKATLLINPRPSNQIFTKYSFPSKNMEYMASGTPVLTTRLVGIPKEYDPYLYYIEEENANGIADKLKSILSKSNDELFSFGMRAKEFILSEKSNVEQAKKLLIFLRNNFKFKM